LFVTLCNLWIEYSPEPNIWILLGYLSSIIITSKHITPIRDKGMESRNHGEANIGSLCSAAYHFYASTHHPVL
jgi:hypothetical protein